MSAAVIILAVCSYRTAGENCTFMVHNPTITKRMLTTFDQDCLDQLIDKNVKVLAETTFLSEEEWREKMSLGTFFDSKTALEWGLIDEII